MHFHELELYEDQLKDDRILLRELVSAEVITKNKEHYFFGQTHMGENEQIAIAFLNDIEHQESKIGMLAELKEKKKII